MLKQLLPNKRTIAFLVLLLLISFCSLSLFGKFKEHNTLFLKIEDKVAPYVPQISLVKSGVRRNLSGTDVGCAFIEYTFTIENQSTAGEILANVVINDPNLGIINSGFSGDDNLNNELDSNEIWIVTQNYFITEQDIINGEVSDQAVVNANLKNQLLVGVQDLSDDNSPLENDLTTVDLTACQTPNIGIINFGDLVDINGDGCKETIIYKITVQNTGTIDLDEIVVTSPVVYQGNIPGPVAGDDIGEIGVLSPGETWNYTFNWPVNTNLMIGGNMETQAIVTAEIIGTATQVSDFSHDSDFNSDGFTNTPVDEPGCIDNGSIGLVKVSDGFVDVNQDGCDDSILYKFTVTNTGNTNLHEIVIEDEDVLGLVDIPGPTENSDVGMDGILSIGETWTYEALYALTQTDIDNASVNNQASVDAYTVNTNLLVQDDSHASDPFSDGMTRTPVNIACVNGSAGIGLIKKGDLYDLNDDGCYESILYEFTVTNMGDVDLKDIVLEDEELLGLADIPGPLDGDDIGGDEVLSVGEVWRYHAVYAITQEDIDFGSVVNQATVMGKTVGLELPVSDNSDNTDNFNNRWTRVIVTESCADGNPEIALIKKGVPIDIDNDGCDESILYTFTVTNEGEINLHSIVVEDEDQLGLADIPGPTDGSDIGLDGILSVGEVWTYEALYQLKQEDIDAGEVINQATATGLTEGLNLPVFDDSDFDNNSENRETHTLLSGNVCTEGAANMYLLKAGNLVDVNGDGCSDSILYTFELTNNGDVDIIEISLEDELIDPDLIGFIPESDTNSDGILSVGETWFFEALYGFTQNDLDMGQVSNRALATGLIDQTNIPIFDYSHETAIDDDGFTVTLVPVDSCLLDASPGIALIKTAALSDLDNDGCPESIDYTFTVSNTGNLDLIEVELIDNELFWGMVSGPVEGTDIDNDQMLSVGETWTFEANYILLDNDIDVGIVTNSATVTAKVVNIDFSVSDISDDNSPNEDDPTQTLIPNIVCNDPGPISDFEIFNGITPNNDGLNDYFQINGIENYPNNNLKIFNRWGVLVYEADGYGLDSNLFYGISEGRATLQKDRELPSGTYFYILSFIGENPGESSYSGYLYINRD
ncbi:gliding motility-associated C-terminal domain-containing protein [Allomuricauda sp. NBRC 101325]|uniref:gliding motility-associated C-terminal domain-containing protein n=1 Tax=Allomuricauda sp. NBRC 101325 TaxID=1113758 RepID=UPI0024A0B17E|nr:gliding motility-associated C-terminal domain-containing protein [Muricauda sp. NBRC 101325]GLU45045.1 hypothetical protein Musp01_26690 [Muricauda sp. NBRC 101325]